MYNCKTQRWKLIVCVKLAVMLRMGLNKKKNIIKKLFNQYKGLDYFSNNKVVINKQL